jgi:alpha-tubulin suppressor-like RCC1 family protein
VLAFVIAGCEPTISIGRISDAGDATMDAEAGVDTCPTALVATHIAAGEQHACAISAGRVMCWGAGLSGQLGGGETETQLVPERIDGQDMFTDLTAMTLGTCARRSTDGMLLCFGENFAGGLANGGSNSSSTPVETITGAVELVGGQSCMLTRDAAGVLTVWGDNSYGKLGLALPDLAIRTETVVPAAQFMPFAMHLAGGAFHTCVTDSDGYVYCAGENSHTQLGMGGGMRDVFTRVTDTIAFDAIDAGQSTTCGVTRITGDLYCWGKNTPVILAGEDDNVDFPTRVGALSGYTQVSVGFSAVCAIRDGGRLYCWGSGESYALGLSDTNDRDVPTEVTPGTPYSRVSVGRHFACAIRASDSVVVCFGLNDNGQLGRGADTSMGPAPICL